MSGVSLSPGERGEEVKKLQEALKKLGYAIGTVDGIFGGKTEAAVKAFQTDRGLKPTGTVSENLYMMIFSFAALAN